MYESEAEREEGGECRCAAETKQNRQRESEQ